MAETLKPWFAVAIPCEDWKLVNALLGERDTLRTEGKRATYREAQGKLFQEGR